MELESVFIEHAVHALRTMCSLPTGSGTSFLGVLKVKLLPEHDLWSEGTFATVDSWLEKAPERVCCWDPTRRPKPS